MDPFSLGERVCKRLQILVFFSAFCRCLAVILFLLLAAVLSDYTWQLPAFLRVLFWPVLLIILGAIILRRIIRPLFVHGIQVLDAIRLIEYKRPACNGLLFAQHQGCELADNEVQHLKKALRDARTRDFVQNKPFIKQLISCLVILLISIIGFISFPDYSKIGLQRLGLPFSEYEWPRKHHIHIGEEKRVVLAQDMLSWPIEQIAGFDEALRITWLQDGLAQERWLQIHDGQWTWKESFPAGSYIISFSNADSLIQVAELKVLTQTYFSQLSVDIQPPAYTGLEPFRSDQVRQEIPEGSLLSVFANIQGDEENSLTQLSIENGNEHWNLRADESDASLSFPQKFPISIETQQRFITADETWEFFARDTYGFQAESQRLYFKVIYDQKPTLSLSGLIEDEAMSLQALAEFRVDTQDDHGVLASVVEVGVAKSLDDAEEAFIDYMQLEKHNLHRQESALFRQTIALEDISFLEEYFHAQRRAQEPAWLHVRVRVWDTKPVSESPLSTGQVSEAELFRIRLVSAQELRRELEQQLSDIHLSLEQTRQSLLEARGEVDQARAIERDVSPRVIDADKDLRNVDRRWQLNKLDEAMAKSIREVQQLQQRTVIDELSFCIANPDEFDTRLEEIIRRLTALLDDDDLLRELSLMIEQQEGQREQTRQALRAWLLGQTDDRRFDTLATAQMNLHKRSQSWERSALKASADDPLAAALTERSLQSLLVRIAPQLRDSQKRQAALEGQTDSLTYMKELYDLLSNASSDEESAVRDELASVLNEQRQLLVDMQNGISNNDVKKRQEDIQKKTQELQQRLGQESKSAAEAAQMAQRAQMAAAQAAEQENRKAAQHNAEQAAALLDQALQELDESESGSDEEGKNPLLALLKELRTRQLEVLEEVQALKDVEDTRLLNEQEKRDLQLQVQAEFEMESVLREKVIRPAEDNPL